MTYYVYIMASASHALYTGVTNDIERRVVQHREARLPSFSARYKTRNLVYMEVFGDIRAAIMREKQIKGWLRIKKLALINSANPQWKDLSAEWPAYKNVIASPGNGVILPALSEAEGSGAKNPSEGFVNKKEVAKNPSESFLNDKPVAKNPSQSFTNEKTDEKHPTEQNTRRGSSLRSE